MIKISKSVTDADLARAAAYYAALPVRRWIRVVETNTVPVMRPDYGGWLDLVPNGGVEPIRGRIIEVPEDTSRMFLMDPHVGLVDYVPVGSLRRGAALVRSGGRTGAPCTSCRGAHAGAHGRPERSRHHGRRRLPGLTQALSCRAVESAMRSKVPLASWRQPEARRNTGCTCATA